MRLWISTLLLAATLIWTHRSLAEAAVAVEHGEPGMTSVDNFPHPRISEDGHWAGAMAIIVLLFFFSAMVIGPIVRSDTPEEVPPAHSHDEPPGTSGHHGHSGTVVEEPHH